MFIHRSLYLLEGEPEQGGATVDPTPPASETPPPASTPDPEADAPLEDAPAEEAEPSAEPEDTEPPAADLTDEDWEALYEKYPDRKPQPAEPATGKQLPPAETLKAQDPFYVAITSQADESYRTIADYSQKLAAGELESADDLLAHIAVTGAWQAASERRGHIAVNRATIERALGIEGGKLEEGNDLHDQYDKLLTSLETAQQAAARKRANAVREYDARKRAAILTEAEVMDARAVGDFYHQTTNLALEKGKLDGKAEAEKSFGKRAPALAEKARTNGHTEAVAKAKQAVLAGKAMSTAAEPSKPTNGELTAAEASTLPIEELIRRGYAPK